MRRAGHSLWQLIDVHASHESRIKPSHWPVPPSTVMVAGTTVPNPAALPPPVPGVDYGFLSCASPEIARCILPDPSVAYRTAAVQRRYREITHTVSDWDAQLGTHDGNAWLARQFVRINAHDPAPWVWLLVAAPALAIRRPRGTLTIVALCLLGGVVLVAHAVSESAETFFALPVVPAAYLAAICAITGRRRGS